MVSFDWPSESFALNYLEDRQDARKTALALVMHGIEPLTARQSNGCEVNVHLLADSTRAFMIREAFDDADDHKYLAHHDWTVSQIAFIAADIDCSDDFNCIGKPASSTVFKGTWEHSWHIGNEVFFEDPYHTLCGDVDRHKIPTGLSFGQNRLQLKV